MTDSAARTGLGRGILMLLVIAGLATALLGLLQQRTAEQIALNEADYAMRLVSEVLPDVDYDNAPAVDLVLLKNASLGSRRALPAYRARLNGEIVAVVLTIVATDGYVGPIEILVGMDTRGNVLAARISKHRETPGLGDAIEVSKSDWILQFTGISGDASWSVRRDGGDFDQLTGATVTSRAVTTAIGNASAFYRENPSFLYATATPSAQD